MKHIQSERELVFVVDVKAETRMSRWQQPVDNSLACFAFLAACVSGTLSYLLIQRESYDTLLGLAVMSFVTLWFALDD